jgi:hypothetical protein
MNGYRLIDIADPLDDTDAVPKKYVDGQIQSIQTSLANVTSALAAINGGSIGSLDAPARDAIGWPYTGTTSLDSRVNAFGADITSLKATLGNPYNNGNSVNYRLNVVETTLTATKATADTAKSTNDTQIG